MTTANEALKPDHERAKAWAKIVVSGADKNAETNPIANLARAYLGQRAIIKALKKNAKEIALSAPPPAIAPQDMMGARTEGYLAACEQIVAYLAHETSQACPRAYTRDEIRGMCLGLNHAAHLAKQERKAALPTAPEKSNG